MGPQDTRVDMAYLTAHRDTILQVAAANGVETLRIFGSVAKGTASAGSDVDVLVTLRPGFGLMALGRIAADLTEFLGVSVDVATEGMLRHDIRDEVLRSAQPL